MSTFWFVWLSSWVPVILRPNRGTGHVFGLSPVPSIGVSLKHVCLWDPVGANPVLWELMR